MNVFIKLKGTDFLKSVREGGPGGGSPPTLKKFLKINSKRANFYLSSEDRAFDACPPD